MRSIQDVLQERELLAEKLKDEIEKLREAARILELYDERPGPKVVAAADSKRWP